MVVGDKVVTSRGWIGIIWDHDGSNDYDAKPWKVYVRKHDGSTDWHYFYGSKLKVLGHCGYCDPHDAEHPLNILIQDYLGANEAGVRHREMYNSKLGRGGNHG